MWRLLMANQARRKTDPSVRCYASGRSTSRRTENERPCLTSRQAAFTQSQTTSGKRPPRAQGRTAALRTVRAGTDRCGKRAGCR